MKRLKQALVSITPPGQALKAVIVDDELDTLGIPSFAEWIILQDALQADPAFREEFLQRLLEMGHNPTDPPSVEMATGVLRLLTSVPEGDIKLALESYTRSKHLLQRLREFLLGLGFSVEWFATKPSFEEGELPFLCLVDYQIAPEEESGETAGRLFSHLMDRAEAEQRPPPFVILMSKALTDSDVDKWSQLAERAGFFRFNYGFLNKEQFLGSSSFLTCPILHFVRHEKLSRAYYLQMNSLVAEAHGIAKRVSKQLFQVSPPEALLFKSKISEEGSSLSEELSDLFAELFSRAIKLSASVVARMDALESVISEEGMPVPYRQQRSALHRLYAELLHQTCDSQDTEPRFGDIFCDENGTYFLILSQECDIAKGESRQRKTDRVIAIEGELKNSVPGKTAGEMIVAKPVFIPDNDQSLWLWWNLGKPTIFPIQQFEEPNFFEVEIATRAYYLSEARRREGRLGGASEDWLEAQRQLQVERRERGFASARSKLRKKWRLRFAEAEDLQHRFATRMTRVALNVMPEFIHVHTLQMSHNEKVIGGASSIFVYEVLNEKKVALAPESLGPCCTADDGKFMSEELVEKLSNFLPITEFHQELERENLFIVDLRGNLLFSKVTGQFKQGKKPWKGLP